MSGRTANIKDVAKLAGVSPKTVSNVINDYVHVTPETRERVEQAIAELGYRPNLTARNLRRGSTGMIALALQELDIPYFAELTRHFLTAAQERGRTVIIEQTLGDLERETAVVAGLGAKMVDGIILSTLSLRGTDLSRRTDTTPLVLLGERSSEGLIDHVAIDNVTASREAVAHLAGLGRTRIAALGTQADTEIGTPLLRLTGYREALDAAGLPAVPTLAVPAGQWHRRQGAEAMRHLLDLPEPPDAVFCFNDSLAVGALRAAHDRGVRVPDDIAVIGFDGTDEARFAVPGLSTVAPDKTGIAEAALRLLIERIDGYRGPAREETVGHELCLRESTLGRTARG